MNILMLGRWLPPPRRPVRAMREYQFAHRLARAHRLTLAFVTDNPDTAGAISTLRSEFQELEFAAVPRAWKSLTGALSLATGESCTLSYFRSEALRTRLGDRLRHTRYDLVCVSASSMVQYVLDIDKTIPVMVDFGEIDSEWWLQRAVRGSFPSTRFFRTEAARLRAAEAAAARRAVRCLASSPEAAEIVKQFAPEAPVIVIPNGVDVDALGSSPVRSKTPTVVLNTSLAGDMEIHDAIEFQRTVMPIVRELVPGARFVILSREPVANPWLSAALAGADLVTGVPDPGPVLHQATVAVAPLRHSKEIRRTILEPMAAGLPVVATSGVLQRLAVNAGHELLAADEPKEFALKVVRLLINDALRAEVGSRARSFVVEPHSWNHLAVQFLQEVEGIGRPLAPAAQAVPEPVVRVQL
jgi:glycosyltransferase involved in cell wall biosynthesis